MNEKQKSLETMNGRTRSGGRMGIKKISRNTDGLGNKQMRGGLNEMMSGLG